MRIVPVIIAVGEKYRQMGRICFSTYAMHNKAPLLALVEGKFLEWFKSQVKSDAVVFDVVGKYEIAAKKKLGVSAFARVKYEDIVHMREYSSMKPLIAELAIREHYPDADYAMTMDADGIYTGDVMSEFAKEIERRKHQYDLYMVSRSDPRMHQLKSRHSGIGSGVTLWKRDSMFLRHFRTMFVARMAGAAGGSQELINKIRTSRLVKGILLKNPLLHMVSPDLVKKLSKRQMQAFKPAYIHLHGTQCVERMQAFCDAFGYEV